VIRILALAVLLLAACDPPAPRPQVAKPLPTPLATPTPTPSPTPLDGPPTKADLAARVPAEVAALEERYREVLTSLEETSAALSDIRTQLDSELPDEQKLALSKRAGGLRDSARRLAAESKELRAEAAKVKATSIQLKALSGAD
jgi:hypothetical protein